MEAAGWAWLAIVLFVVGFEGWAIATHHLTLSQWLQHQIHTHVWAKYLSMSGFFYLLIHLFG